MKKTLTSDQVLELKANIIMLKARIAEGNSTYTDEFELDELQIQLDYDTRMKAFSAKGFKLLVNKEEKVKKAAS